MRDAKTSSWRLPLLACIALICISWTPSTALAEGDGKAQVKEVAESAPETPAGQIKLGERYRDGKDGVEKDYAKALQWFEKAAAQGDSEGIYQLGRCHWYGWGVDKDLGKANELFLKAAEQGHLKGQYAAAQDYYLGHGVEKDYAKAFKWFEKATAQGHAGAQYYMGLCYGRGNGVEQNRVEASKWFTKAAEQKDELAQIEMACLHLRDDGYGADPEKAIKYIESIADGKSDTAHLMCLVCANTYLTGMLYSYSLCDGKLYFGNVKRNPEKAVKFAERGIEFSKGLDRCLFTVLLVSANFTKGDFGQVRKLLVECLGKYPMLKWALALAILAAISWVALMLALLLWLSRKFKPASGAWSFYDILYLVFMIVPLLIVIQASVLLPFHFLVSAMLGMCVAGYICILLFAFIIKRRGFAFKTAFGLEKTSLMTLLLWLQACLVITFLVDMAYEWLCKLMGIHIDPQLIASLISSKTLSHGSLAFCFVMGAFLLPVMEELIFRGIIYQSLRTKMKPWIAIAISAAIFSAWHLEMRWFIPLFVMGAMLAYARERTGSLYVPMAMHCANNSIVLTLVIIGWI